MLIMVRRDGAITSPASFNIRGDIPSSPVALVASSEFRVLLRLFIVNVGILKKTLLGIPCSLSLLGSYSVLCDVSGVVFCMVSLMLAKKALRLFITSVCVLNVLSPVISSSGKVEFSEELLIFLTCFHR